MTISIVDQLGLKVVKPENFGKGRGDGRVTDRSDPKNLR